MHFGDWRGNIIYFRVIKGKTRAGDLYAAETPAGLREQGCRVVVTTRMEQVCGDDRDRPPRRGRLPLAFLMLASSCFACLRRATCAWGDDSLSASAFAS